MYATLRNKRTGEFRDVDQAEFKELITEVTGDGFPAWEQTSYANADEVQRKATYGELLEHHLGENAKDLLKHEALALDAEEVAPEHNPHLQLTPGEIEAGLTPEDKLEQLRRQYAPSVPRREEIMQQAHEEIAEGEVQTPGRKKSRGLKARAGGSEEIDRTAQAERIAAGGGDDDNPEEDGDPEEQSTEGQESDTDGQE